MIITISRQAGTNGAAIGRIVAERLGYRIYDDELVDEIARRLHVDPEVACQFDETHLNVVDSVLLEWRDSINEDIYGRFLRQALRRIGEEGNAVVIGRGANFVLKCPGCLHVRLIAPPILRAAITMAIHHESEQEATARLRHEDERRKRFIHAYFHADITDPQSYDLVINLSGLTPEMAADVIIFAAHLREAEQMPALPEATLPHHFEVMARHRKPVPPPIVERMQKLG